MNPAGSAPRGIPREVLSALERLRETTVRQIEAARALRGRDLQRYNRERVDVLFELRLLLSDRMPQKTPELSDALVRLRAEEERLEAVAKAVLGVVQRIDPTWPATTYGRTGDLR